MHPDVGHGVGAVGAAGLGDLVLVVREDEVEPAAVDVEDLAEIALAHGRAFDVPARTAPAPGAVPARLLGRGLLPEDEIGRVLLVRVDGDAGAGELVLEVAARELAVVGHRADIEQHLAAGLVGVAALDQRADERLHLGDIVGGARLDRRLEAAERGDVGMILRGGLLGDLADRLVERQVGKSRSGTGVDLVVDVGDVADIGDVVRAVDMAQQTEQHVEDDGRAGIADMGEVVDRRAADIHAHVCRIDGDKVLLLARQRVVEPQMWRCPKP